MLYWVMLAKLDVLCKHLVIETPCFGGQTRNDSRLNELSR